MLIALSRPADGIALLELNNPPLNLVTLDLTRQLGETLDALAADTSVRAVVVAGAGDKAFCAGSDVREFPRVRERVVDAKLRRENAVWTQLEDLRQPTIAAIEGWALGGGFELALCCDLRILSENARVGLPEIHLAVIPGTGGPLRLTRLIGESRAKSLLYLGETVSAADAAALGIAYQVVPPGRTRAAALDLARRLAEAPALALQACKRAVRDAEHLDRDAALEHALDLSARVFRSEDVLEGVAAFLEKRPARFRHR
jgi:enoyl-CoA hydratase